MAKIIDIKYPDNTIHNVICNRLYQVNVDGETLYVLEPLCAVPPAAPTIIFALRFSIGITSRYNYITFVTNML